MSVPRIPRLQAWGGHQDAEYSRNDTLKRRVAVLEGAGNTLARAAVDLPDAYSIELDDALRAWRSAAGTPTTEGGQS